MNLRLVSLSGASGCGKDLAAEGLASLGWTTLGWSQPIRAITAHIWPDLTEEQVNHDRERPLPEPLVLDADAMRRLVSGLRLHAIDWSGRLLGQPLYDWHESLPEPPSFDTMRAWQQFFGTDIVRTNLGENFWVDHMRHVVRSVTLPLHQQHAVITGARYANERAMLVEPDINAYLVYVSRPGHEPCRGGIDNHSSESSFGSPTDYHLYLVNNGTPAQLQDTLVRAVLNAARGDQVPPLGSYYRYVESAWSCSLPMPCSDWDGFRP